VQRSSIFVWQTLVATPVRRPCVEAILKAAHRSAKDLFLPAAFVADDLASLDGDQRGGVAETAQALGDFLGDELSVGEDLEVAVGMSGKDIEQLRVHERFAAEQAEEGVAVRLRVADEAIHRIEIEGGALGFDIHPATLAAQVAGVDDRDVEERREVLAVAQPPLEALDGEHPFHPEIPEELPDAFRVGGAQGAKGELREHGGGVWTRPGTSAMGIGAPNFPARQEKCTGFHYKADEQALPHRRDQFRSLPHGRSASKYF
jgi:hypothetical protein